MKLTINNTTYDADCIIQDNKAYLIIHEQLKFITIVNGKLEVKCMTKVLKPGMSSHLFYIDGKEFTSEYQVIESVKFPVAQLELL